MEISEDYYHPSWIVLDSLFVINGKALWQQDYSFTNFC
jgi:hypothetical protein